MLKKIVNIRLAVAFVIVVAVVAAYFVFYHLPMERAKGWQAEGDSAIAEGNIDTAIYDYMRGVDEFPRLKGIHLALGKALLVDSRGDEAIDAFEKEIEISPGSEQAHLLLGFLQLMSVTPDDPFGRYVVGSLPPLMGLPGLAGKKLEFMKLADYPLTEALYHFKYAEELAPYDLAPAYGLAVMEGLRGDFDQAEDRLNEIIGRDPGNQFANNTLSQLEYFKAYDVFQGGLDNSFTPSAPQPGPEDQPLLPPLAGGWEEGNPEGDTGQPKEPPDISAEGKWDSPEFDNPSGQNPSDLPPAEVTPEGDVILRPGAFDVDPKTRPIGPIKSFPGNPPEPLVTIGNRFKSGQVSLSPGQTAEVPETGISVTLVDVDGNKVRLIENGIEYTWVRGKVEWTWLPDETKRIDNKNQSETPDQ